MNQTEQYELAAKLYDDMMENYRNFCDDPLDCESADLFLIAVCSLCDLQIKNPFADLSGKSFSYNAAIKPSSKERIVTAVIE